MKEVNALMESFRVIINVQLFLNIETGDRSWHL